MKALKYGCLNERLSIFSSKKMVDYVIMKALSAWIFDLDGTLTESTHDFDFIRKRLGVPPGKHILEYSQSIPSEESIPLLNKLSSLEQSVIKDTQIAEGAYSLIKLLHSKSYPLGILTRNTKENAIETLAHIGLNKFFLREFIIGREQQNPKPSPEGIYYLLGKWKKNLNSGVIVGDYRLDLEAGRNAGISTILIGDITDKSTEELADFQFQTLSELKNSVENHLLADKN